MLQQTKMVKREMRADEGCRRINTNNLLEDGEKLEKKILFVTGGDKMRSLIRKKLHWSFPKGGYGQVSLKDDSVV